MLTLHHYIHPALADLAQRTLQRVAVRGICLNEKGMLLQRTRLGAYKIPGGALENGEDDPQALTREMLEETGRPILWIRDLLGISEEYFPARDEGYAIFHMMVRYYPCRVGEAQAALNLGEYELVQQLQPVWVPPVEALKANQALLFQMEGERWLPRDTAVLRYVVENSF